MSETPLRDIPAMHHDANVAMGASASGASHSREHSRSPLTRMRGLLARWLLLVTAATSVGCIPPPIIADVEEEFPPFISSEFVSPADQIIQATSDDTITLRLSALFDQNAEERLYVAWYNPSAGVLRSTMVQRTTTDEGPDAFNIFYTFGSDEVVVDPCNGVFAGSSSETFWAYVSDEPWALVDNVLGVQEQNGAFKVSYSWVIEFNVLCTDT